MTNLGQSGLFSESILDALSDVVRALGGAKVVGPLMRPSDLSPLQAGKWVLDCLNADRRERFDPEQVMWLLRKGREIGCHSAIHFICDETGYGRPTPIEPLDEAAELQRKAEALTRELRTLVGRMERIGVMRSVA